MSNGSNLTVQQVVANFSAQWCSPCKKIAPVYIQLADKYPSMICLTVDVDGLPVSMNTFCAGHQNFLQINGVKS